MWYHLSGFVSLVVYTTSHGLLMLHVMMHDDGESADIPLSDSLFTDRY